MIVGRGQTDNCHRTCEDGATVQSHKRQLGWSPRPLVHMDSRITDRQINLSFQLSFPLCSEVVPRKEGHLL